MPNVKFGQKVSFHSDIKEAIVGSKNIVLAIPSQNVREIMSEIKNSIDPSIYIINVAKGIERETLKTVSEVVFDVIKDFSNFVKQDICITNVLAGRHPGSFNLYKGDKDVDWYKNETGFN